TPGYMAPEQAGGRSDTFGPATDVYGLGGILYYLLTGRAPIRAPTVAEILLQTIDSEPVRPSLLRPGCPRDLETICLKCLSKEQAKRYPSARALAEDLRRFQSGEPVAARPVSAFERARRWCRRNPALAGMTAAVAALMLVAVAAVSAAYAIDRGHA